MQRKITMRYLGLWAAVAVLAAGCTNYKEPARMAIQEVQYSLQAVSTDAAKYLPDELAALQADYDKAKVSFEKGDYKEALTGVRSLKPKISALSAKAAATKEQQVAALNGTWQTMSTELPKLVQTIESRLNTLSRTKKLPKNVTQSGLEQAKAGLADVKKLWDEASQASSSGNLEIAVSKGTDLQAKGREVMTLLGMEPAPAAA